MLSFLERLPKSEKGQALPIVLMLLLIGSLIIAGNLNFAITVLKGSRIVVEDMKGIYAASAGVENALWSLKVGGAPPTQLPQNINQMDVGIQTLNEGTFTLYFGEMIDASSVHVDWLDVSGNITPLGSDIYRYTITVTWQPASGNAAIKLEEVGARIPIGYSYQAGSSNLAGNLQMNDSKLTTATDTYGAYLLKWNLDTPRPEVSESQLTRTQIFNITGTESTSGHYANVRAQPESVGMVGEIKGTRYKITATATRPQDSRTTAEIVADAIIADDGTVDVVSWQITR